MLRRLCIGVSGLGGTVGPVTLQYFFQCFVVICEYLHDLNVFCLCGSMFQEILQMSAKTYDSDQ